MESTPAPSDHPDEEIPPRGRIAVPDDALGAVATRLAAYDASPEARTLLAQILAATLAAFTHSSSVRDPLPDTAPGTAQEALAVLAGIDHLRSSLSAVDASWQVIAEQRIRRDDQEQGLPVAKQGSGAAHEIGLARRVSPASSSFSLASARRLIQHMPATVESLWAGRLTERQASTVASSLDGADPSTCARIDQLIADHPETLQGKGHRELKSDLQTMIQRLEPETSRQRAERAARSRHVTMMPLADGMARVTAILRGIDAAGMMQALHTQAESLRAAGAKESVPALEADLLVDAVRTDVAGDPSGDAARRPSPTPGLDVGIVITDTALLGRGDDIECAQLEGYGAIPAHIVTDTLRGSPPGHLRHAEHEHPDRDVTAFYRRLYVGPGTGELIGMESRARLFPSGLARMIRWRDVTCRTPWCNAVIRQIDHAVPHSRGGATTYDNGQGLCVRCNLLKEHGGWELTPLFPATHEDGPPTSAAGATPAPEDPALEAPAPGALVSEAPPPSLIPPPPNPPAPPAAPASSPEHAAPPSGWGWLSPHGATGINRRRPLLGPGTRRGLIGDTPAEGAPPDATPP